MIAIVLSLLSSDLASCFDVISSMLSIIDMLELVAIAGHTKTDVDAVSDAKDTAAEIEVCDRLFVPNACLFSSSRSSLASSLVVISFLHAEMIETILSPLEAAIAAMMSPSYGSPSEADILPRLSPLEADDLVEQSPS